jgi:hypothetical protein
MKMRKDQSIVAKTYGGTSWSVLHTVKDIKGPKDKKILNVFGVYDYTNDQIWTHGYKQKRQASSFWIL